MKLLVVGSDEHTLAFCAQLMRAAGPKVTCCADAQRALEAAEVSQGGYEWILVAGQGRPRDDFALVCALRRRSPGTPISVLAHEAVYSNESAPPMCAIDVQDDGMQILRCALHQQALAERVEPRNVERQDRQPVVFEYHAPCRKSTRN